MRKEYELQKRKTGKFKLKMTFAILVLTALSIVEVYLMMNYQMEYLYLGAVGLVILCFVYWIVDISFQMQAEDDTAHEKEYENLYKAEKVSYISMKQGLLDIENILKGMEDLPVDDVIQSQKAIGKVTIQRNKESMQAVIDAQKELKERMDALEDKLNGFQGISERQQEILDAIQNMESSVKEGISVAAASGSIMQDNQGTQELNLVEEAEQISSEASSVEDELSSQEQAVGEAEEAPKEEKQEEAAPGAMMTEDQIAELLASQDQAADESTEEVPKDEKQEEEKREEAVPGAMMTEDQIAELLASQDQAVDESTEEAPKEEKQEEKQEEAAPGAMMTEEQIADLLASQDQASDESTEEAPKEEKQEEAAPGAMMTEDQIAELLASQDQAAEAPVAEEPAVSEEASEEKPDMPDLSDPGHVMTPEEIAALLANM